MLQQFTHAELRSFNRTQLWSLCRERGLKCYPASADCVEAIWTLAQSVTKVQVAEVIVDSQAVAQKEFVTHIEAQAQEIAPEIHAVEISFFDHEVYALGKQIAAITHDPDDFQTQRWVVMVGETEVHRADAWAKCHSYITWHYKQGTLPTALPVVEQLKSVDWRSPEIEVDEQQDEEFGLLYRVWNSNQLLGTFYHAISGEWVVQSCFQDDRPRCNTAAEAQLIIVALAGRVVADSGDDGIDLLNKPVDELTVAEWQAIKLAAQQAELVAA